MKKWIVLISVLAGCLSLVACGSEAATAPERVPTKAPAVVTEKEPVMQENEITPTPSPFPTPTEAPLSPVYDFSITLFEKELTFPMWYGQMINQGWSDIYDEADLEPGEAGVYLIGNACADVYGIFYNCTDKSHPFFGCAIAGLRLNEELIEEYDIEAVLPGNIILGTSTEADIVTVYGEPTTSQDGVLRYELTSNRYVKLNVAGGVLKEIEICNVADLGERPMKYAVEASEDTLFSFRVQLDGVEYQLPMQYSDLEANGWVSQDNPDDMIEHDREGGWGSWVKDGFCLFTYYYNEGDTDIPLRDCTIYGVQANDQESIPMFKEYSGMFVLPGEISLMESAAEKDALVAYGPPTRDDGDNCYFVYEYGETGRVRLYYDRYSPHTITGITVEYFPFMEGRQYGSEG